MSAEPIETNASGLEGVHPKRLFAASCIALVSTAVVFSVITSNLGQLKVQFGLDNEQVGTYVRGTTIWGFTLSIFILGPLCDALGMRFLMRFAFVCHLVGVLVMVFARQIGNSLGIAPFYPLAIGSLVLAMGNGTVEAACNPLTATLFPDRKTQKLNRFHMWWPGGLVLGGLAAYFIDNLVSAKVWEGSGLATWQVKLALVLIPTVIYGILFTGQKFPKTERVQSGISFGGMVKATVLRPLFILLFICMMMTASLELGPNAWIGEAMKGALKAFGENAGVLVLVYISALMAVLRYYAGPVVHRFSNTGVLLLSSVLAGAGLLLLTLTESPALVFIAATVFSVGVCYFWPTMLGTAAERVPKGGALALAILGGTGMAVVGLVTVPIMGWITDTYGHGRLPVAGTTACIQQVLDTYPGMMAAAKDKDLRQAFQDAIDSAEAVRKDIQASRGALPMVKTAKALRSAVNAAPDSAAGKKAKSLVAPADTFGALISFRWVSASAIVLVVIFGLLYISDRAKGGYKAEKIA